MYILLMIIILTSVFPNISWWLLMCNIHWNIDNKFMIFNLANSCPVLFSSQRVYCYSGHQNRLAMMLQHLSFSSKGNMNNKASWASPSESHTEEKADRIWLWEMEKFCFLLHVFNGITSNKWFSVWTPIK